MVTLVKIPAELRDTMWRDAWRIAWVGASNPTAVAYTLQQHTSALTRLAGTRDACHYPALRAITGHLAAMFGHGLGPTFEQLDLVKVNAERLGLNVRL